jgi:hypothetical protein
MFRKKDRFVPKTMGAWLFPFILAAAVLQNYYDFKAIFDGGALNLSTYEGPIVFKLLKDIIYLGLLAVVIWVAFQIKRWPATLASMLFVILVLFSFSISAAMNDFTIAAIGLRWVMPFVLFLFLRDAAARINPDKGIVWLFFGMLFCLFAQIYQLFNMPPIYGEIFGGWPARTPGIFLAPNSTAFFACSCCACISAFAWHKYWTRVAAACMSLLICLLAQSGTGILTATVLLIWLASGRYSSLSLIVAATLGALIFFNLDAITMREDYVATSGGNRLDVFVDTLGMAMTSIGNFGIYTNAGALNENVFAVNFAVDSLWASWFGNFGVLAPVQLAIVAAFFLQIKKEINWRLAFPCVLVFFLFSMTTIIFEAYPMNLLLGFGVWAAKNFPRGRFVLVNPARHDYEGSLKTGQCGR